jgi:hypothetical protein
MKLSIPCLIAVMGLAPGNAQAQHARTVLLGEPNADAADVPESHRFVHPLSAPYHHEDAFITSDVRAWFLYHQFDDDTQLGDDGDLLTLAAQLRLAITDRLQLVAYKDGYIWIDTPLVDKEGWADIAAGLKYAIVQNFKDQFHWAVGVGYEFPWGDPKVLSNDDEVRVWTSVNKGYEAWHLGAVVNLFVPTNGDDSLGNSDRLSWHLHADYRLNDWFSPVLEMNGYHILDAGDSPLEFQGVDLANIGTGAGDLVITLAPGAEFRPHKDIGLRGAFEFPLTNEKDLFGARLTLSAVWSF